MIVRSRNNLSSRIFHFINNHCWSIKTRLWLRETRRLYWSFLLRRMLQDPGYTTLPPLTVEPKSVRVFRQKSQRQQPHLPTDCASRWLTTYQTEYIARCHTPRCCKLSVCLSESRPISNHSRLETRNVALCSCIERSTRRKHWAKSCPSVSTTRTIRKENMYLVPGTRYVFRPPPWGRGRPYNAETGHRGAGVGGVGKAFVLRHPRRGMLSYLLQ